MLGWKHPIIYGVFVNMNSQQINSLTSSDATPRGSVRRAIAAVQRRLSAFERGVRHLQEFYRVHGHCNVPVTFRMDCIDESNKPYYGLGHWVANQRARYKAGALSKEEVSTLNAFPGWSWIGWNRHWDVGYERLVSYAAKNGHARVPSAHVEDGFPLGAWLAKLRLRAKVGTLEDAHQQALRKIDPDILSNWKRIDSNLSWANKLEALHAFIQSHGHAQVPRDYLTHSPSGEPINLGVWVNGLRALKNRGMLDAQRVKILDAIPAWTWAGKPGRRKKEATPDPQSGKKIGD